MYLPPMDTPAILYALTAAIIGALGGGGIVAAFLRHNTEHRDLSLKERQHIDKIGAELRQELIAENRFYRQQVVALSRRVDRLEQLLRQHHIPVPNGKAEAGGAP